MRIINIGELEESSRSRNHVAAFCRKLLTTYSTWLFWRGSGAAFLGSASDGPLFIGGISSEIVTEPYYWRTP